jgi:hypothetical protein
MDELNQNPAPETEALPVDATPVEAPETEAPVEEFFAHLESIATEAIHTIERRTFGRASADHPVVVTNIVGGQ